MVKPGATRALAGVALAFAAALLVFGCGLTPRTNVDQVEVKPEIIQSAVRFQKEYLLFAGDQIEVAVWRVPEASRTVIVRADGMISLPILQDVPAAGLSPRELAANLKTLFAARLLNPEVAVIPILVRQPVVYVLGDVKIPAAVPYRGAQTAMQAIGIAGGFLRSGSEHDVTIIRLSKDGFLRAIPIDVAARGQPGPYLAIAMTQLEPDDVVFVPEHGRSQVVRFLDEIVLRPTQLLINYRLFQLL
jgi:protein involved in polysaccharide export with SLBB domain